MWSLRFFIWSPGMLYPTESHINGVRNGSWVVSLELVNNSPDTWLDSRLTIGRPSQSSPILISPHHFLLKLFSFRRRPTLQIALLQVADRLQDEEHLPDPDHGGRGPEAARYVEGSEVSPALERSAGVVVAVRVSVTVPEPHFPLRLVLLQLTL